MGKQGAFLAADAAADLHNGILLVLRVLRYEQQLDLLLHLGDGGLQLRNLAARHLAHLVILVVNQHILRLGQIGQRRAVTLRSLDDGLQLLVLLVQLDELLDVGYNLRVGELLSHLLVFEFEAVEARKYRIVCHKRVISTVSDFAPQIYT